MNSRSEGARVLFVVLLSLLSVMLFGGDGSAGLVLAAPPDAPRAPRTFAEKTSRAIEAPPPNSILRAVLPKSRVSLEPAPNQRHDRFVVKFLDDRRVRLRDGALMDLEGGALPGLAAATALPGVRAIRAMFSRSEADLDRDRAFAQKRSGLAIADPNHYYLVELDSSVEPSTVSAAWLALPCVETLYFEGRGSEPCDDIGTFTPSFQGDQMHLFPSPIGVDAFFAWDFDPAGAGNADYWVVDVERGWNPDHEDLPDFIPLNGPPLPTSSNHGTAVLGQLVGCPGDFGITGMVHNVTAGIINWQNEDTIADALDLAASYLSPGELYLVEIHVSGPVPPGASCTCTCGSSFGFLPAEWEQGTFDIIQLHTAAGITVVQAAGNGEMDLDHPFYNGLFDRDVRDSGAIIVGAGSPLTHAPLCFTNHGTRIDCHGHGEAVTTSGFGDLFGGSGEDELYTEVFGGTSSAAAVVAGAATSLQNIVHAQTGAFLDPLSVRDFLATLGTPQGAPLDVLIGVIPDLEAILEVAFSDESFLRGDVDGNGGFTGLIDGVYLLDYAFGGGPPPPCLDAADADDDGFVSPLVDATLLLTHQFAGGPPPALPYPLAGPDPTPDLLDCD